ncbi:hypothetical protein IFM89_018292 [Coptis chinensis]|uniref:Uncharacterized protein n=1 Tax=Coptis chinensis TaxID=261450 RepID=A0A835LZT8_9MAGN|nr:hypothetical protein IFM89_018292 [Coptis chinensis]
MANRERERDRELLIPVSGSVSDDEGSSSKPSSSSFSVSTQLSSREAFGKVVQSWASKKFMTGCTQLNQKQTEENSYAAKMTLRLQGSWVCNLYYFHLLGWNVHVILGGRSLLGIGEWFIKRMPFVRHIYNASKQISSAISPDQNSQAFKEVAIIKHPRVEEYALGFITSSVVLQSYSGDEELCCVYVPTNHMYIGDIFLIDSRDIIRPNLSVREGIEIIISVGMSMPQILSTVDRSTIQFDRSSRVGRN